MYNNVYGILRTGLIQNIIWTRSNFIWYEMKNKNKILLNKQ